MLLKNYANLLSNYLNKYDILERGFQLRYVIMSQPYRFTKMYAWIICMIMGISHLYISILVSPCVYVCMCVSFIYFPALSLSKNMMMRWPDCISELEYGRENSVWGIFTPKAEIQMGNRTRFSNLSNKSEILEIFITNPSPFSQNPKEWGAHYVICDILGAVWSAKYNPGLTFYDPFHVGLLHE